MRILIHKPSTPDADFLTAVGFTNSASHRPNNLSYELPPGWTVQNLPATESLDSFLVDPRGNIRADLLGVGAEGGCIVLPRTAYQVVEKPGHDRRFLILCRSRINRTLLIQSYDTRDQAEGWLSRAYPDWRDPAKHWGT
ncbi:MAG: hypothetical protein RJB39_352 [Candidatus Parcubacteria bacterium]|jgi:hypothetical protein